MTGEPHSRSVQIDSSQPKEAVAWTAGNTCRPFETIASVRVDALVHLPLLNHRSMGLTSRRFPTCRKTTSS
jgi:hypothetical protein